MWVFYSQKDTTMKNAFYAQTYKGKVKRIVAKENDNINETWIADRDRFSYEGLAHENRFGYKYFKAHQNSPHKCWFCADLQGYG